MPTAFMGICFCGDCGGARPTGGLTLFVVVDLRSRFIFAVSQGACHERAMVQCTAKRMK